MHNGNTPTRRQFVTATGATLVGLGITDQAAADEDSRYIVSGAVRGVFDGFVVLQDTSSGEDRDNSRKGKAKGVEKDQEWREEIAFDSVNFSFEEVPTGDYVLQVFERDSYDGNEGVNKSLKRTIRVDSDKTIDSHIDNVRGVFAVPKPIDEMKTEINKYRDLGITDLYLRTFHLAQTIYPSDHVPQKGQFNDDYFERVIEYTHQQGIRIHAWTQVFYWWNAKYFGDVSTWHPLAGNDEIEYQSSYFDSPVTLNRSLVTSRKDDTVVAENGKIFASPFNESVRETLVNVFKEMDQKFALDGINLDYIRFPGFRYYDADDDGEYEFVGEAYGYGNSSPIADDATYAEAQERRVQAITSFVKEVGETVDEETVLSADVFNSFYTDDPSNHLNRNKAQDWKSWIGTTGIDWLHPMVYDSIYGFDVLTDGLEFAYDAESDGVTILPGLTNIGGHASFQDQWDKSLSQFDISGYIAFKGETIEDLDSLP